MEVGRNSRGFGHSQSEWPKAVELFGGLGARSRLLETIEESLSVIWVRSRVCLGGATLKVVFDRVLVDARVRWPHLAFIEVSCTGIRFHRQHPSLAGASEEALAESFVDLVGQLVAVLGDLSGQVLSAPLRAVVNAVGGDPVRD